MQRPQDHLEFLAAAKDFASCSDCMSCQEVVGGCFIVGNNGNTVGTGFDHQCFPHMCDNNNVCFNIHAAEAAVVALAKQRPYGIDYNNLTAYCTGYDSIRPDDTLNDDGLCPKCLALLKEAGVSYIITYKDDNEDGYICESIDDVVRRMA